MVTTIDTPIYDRLSSEYLRAGKNLPWFLTLGHIKNEPVRIFASPPDTYTTRVLESETTGIHPEFSRFYKREVPCTYCGEPGGDCFFVCC